MTQIICYLTFVVIFNIKFLMVDMHHVLYMAPLSSCYLRLPVIY